MCLFHTFTIFNLTLIPCYNSSNLISKADSKNKNVQIHLYIQQQLRNLNNLNCGELLDFALESVAVSRSYTKLYQTDDGRNVI